MNKDDCVSVVRYNAEQLKNELNELVQWLETEKPVEKSVFDSITCLLSTIDTNYSIVKSFVQMLLRWDRNRDVYY